MPIDGTYGRLSAHNQRFKELRRKKIERRERKLWRNSLKDVHRGKTENDINLKNIDSKKLEQLKIEIRKKAKAELRTELYISLTIILVLVLLFYFLVVY